MVIFTYARSYKYCKPYLRRKNLFDSEKGLRDGTEYPRCFRMPERSGTGASIQNLIFPLLCFFPPKSSAGYSDVILRVHKCSAVCSKRTDSVLHPEHVYIIQYIVCFKHTCIVVVRKCYIMNTVYHTRCPSEYAFLAFALSASRSEQHLAREWNATRRSRYVFVRTRSYIVRVYCTLCARLTHYFI